MSRASKILVAGVGNIFLGDDAFGSEVARRLMNEQLPPGVRVTDFGIRSYDLAYALMDGYDVTILVDATSQKQAPGTVYLIEPDLRQLDNLDETTADAHGMSPVKVLQMLRTFGSSPGRLYLVGCEPAILEVEDGQIGLSEIVEASIPRAIELIKSLVNDLLSEKHTMKLELSEPLGKEVNRMRPLSTTGLVILVAIITAVVVSSLPGLQRYLRISSM
jgi:hydrogenase maturation protease